MTFFEPSLVTAHCAAPMLEGNGPSFVETMFFDSKHSDTAHAAAIDMTSSAA